MAIVNDIKEGLAALDTGRRSLRNFGLLFLIVGALITAWLLYRGLGGWPWVGAAAVLFGLAGLFFPKALKHLYLVWMCLALIMGWFVSRLLLALLFYLLVTPLGVVLKIMGKDLIDSKFDESESYWSRRDSGYDPEQSEKMY